VGVINRPGCNFKNMNEIGPECEPIVPVPVDVWAKVLDLNTKEPTGFVRRLGMRSKIEVFGDLKKALEIDRCEQCGHERRIPKNKFKHWEKYQNCPKCKAEKSMFDIVDEYFMLPDRERAGWIPSNIMQVVCYASTGGNEGHRYEVGFLLERDEPRGPIVFEYFCGGKTFRGMEHAQFMAARCAELLGC